MNIKKYEHNQLWDLSKMATNTSDGGEFTIDEDTLTVKGDSSARLVYYSDILYPPGSYTLTYTHTGTYNAPMYIGVNDPAAIVTISGTTIDCSDSYSSRLVGRRMNTSYGGTLINVTQPIVISSDVEFKMGVAPTANPYVMTNIALYDNHPWVPCAVKKYSDQESEWADTPVWVRENGAWITEATILGALPLTAIKTTGEDILDYKIYGASGGVGDYVAPEYKQVHTDTVTIDGIVWDILGYDHDTVYKSDNTLAQHSVTIQTHDVLSDMQFDAKEALFAFDSGLAAGTYHFTVGAQPWHAGDVGKTIQFTLAQAVPAGGQLVINNAYSATMIDATISVFASGTATAATETVTMSEGSSGTDLGTVTSGLSQDGNINSIQRALAGSSNWSESCIRQYLNSAASAGLVWEPKTKWDRPPTWAANTAGFLNGMSADFIANLGTASKTTALNTITDGGGTGTTLDKVFLISRSEAYAGDEVTGGEGAAYPYYRDFSDLSAPGAEADGNRIKYRNEAIKYWWLRSPYATYANNARDINTTGMLSIYLAEISFCVAPACCIPLDDIETNDWLREKFLKNPSTAYGYEVDMSVQSGNLFDPNAMDPSKGYIESAYIRQMDGEIISDGSYYISEYLAVEENAIYTWIFSPVSSTVHSSPTVECVDMNYNRISVVTHEMSVKQFDFVTPQGCKYIRASVFARDKNNSALYNNTTTPVYIGSDPLSEDEYVNYGEGKIYRMSGGTLTPTDPPVPLPALPTFSDTDTIIDYEATPAPSNAEIKYKRRW